MLKVKKIGAFWHVLTSSGVTLYKSMQRANCRDFIDTNYPQQA